jgi:hypothetical protein
MTQSNFDLFHPPTFTVAANLPIAPRFGTQQQDYLARLWSRGSLGAKLALGIDYTIATWRTQPEQHAIL